jgi:hypothetical protein
MYTLFPVHTQADSQSDKALIFQLQPFILRTAANNEVRRLRVPQTNFLHSWLDCSIFS